MLDERVILVTGASRGIGRAIATRAAAAGARVVLAARDAKRLAEVAAAIGERATAVVCNVRDESACQTLLTRVRDEHGGLDALVNNAAAMIPGTVEGYATDDLRLVLDTNVIAPFTLMRDALPLLEGREGATIVNILSLAPTVAQPGLGVYAASKAALLALTDALREEVRERGIRVGAILPGSTRTALRRELGDADGTGDTGDDWMLDPNDVADAVLTMLTMPPRALISRLDVRPVRRKGRPHPPRR